MRKRGIVGVLLVLLGLVFNAHAQVDINRVQSFVNVLEYLGQSTLDVFPEDIYNNWDNSDFFEVEGAALSPDASKLAWHGLIRERVSNLTRDVACVHSFETVSTFCVLPLEERQTYSPMAWSSDGRYVFFTDDRIEDNNETDIWVIAVEEQLLVNLTDDGQFGTQYDSTAAKRDIAPTWDSFNKRLYFLRDIAPTGISPVWELRYFTEDEIALAVNDYNARLTESFQARIRDFRDFQATLVVSTQVAMGDAEATRQAFGFTPDPNRTPIPTPAVPDEVIGVVADLNLDDFTATPFLPIDGTLVATLDQLPAGSALVDTYRELLQSPTDIDNGGLFMAMVLNNEDNPAQSGLWLVDLAAGGLIPMFTAENFITEEPAWITRQTLNNVAWTTDNTGLLLSVENQGTSATYNSVYYFDLGTGVLTSVLDYGILETEGAFFSGNLSFITPDTGVILPGNSFLYFNRSSRNILNGVQLPPPLGGTQPMPVDLGRNLAQQRRLPSSAGWDDQTIRVMFDLNLITIGR